MKSKYNGGQAFPFVYEQIICSDKDSEPERRLVFEKGMNLRDYFAAKAMQSLVRLSGIDPFSEAATNGDYALLSDRSYKFADAMLKARDQ